MNDVELLKIGRHFRLSENTKLIVGRNKMENEVLESLKIDDDIIIEVSNHVGPTCILRTNKKQSEKEIEIAAATALRYSDSPKDEISIVRVKMGHEKEEKEKELQVSPIDDKILNKLRI
jgi:predicted ribosome quality control (RQC) complex YloA/Tae2 family protein